MLAPDLERSPMASNIRRGTIPHSPQGTGDYHDEVYTLGGFFGEWAHVYRRGNMGQPIRWSDDRLMYGGIDSGRLRATDADAADGAPLPLLRGDGIELSLSQRSHPMPFAEKDVDLHQIRFYHRGAFRLETELGPLDVTEGDFVVIPKGLVYREHPQAADGNAVFVFGVDANVHLAEELWDSVGFSSFLTDYSTMVLPSPGDHPDSEVDVETDVRVRYRGEYHTVTYDFDPCKDVIGWLGDPVIFKMNIWDVPALGSSRGFMPPPAGAVLYGEGRSWFFNAAPAHPFPTTPAPEGSYGAPSHQNDYDEVWLNHVSALAPDSDGHLWFLPRTIAHPGVKFPPAYPKNPVRQPRLMKINFDTRAELSWTEEAKAALIDDPLAGVYTSFSGIPLEGVPERYRKRLGDSAQ
jgi:homogentisate 1,2-dioxygenase